MEHCQPPGGTLAKRALEMDMPFGSGKISPREVAFDIDGVVADTFKVFVRAAQEEYGVLIDYEEITDYEFWKVIDIDEETTHEIIDRILCCPLEMGIMPINGAVEVLTRLSRLVPVLFVTAREERDAILEWVVAHFDEMEPRAIRLEAVGTHEEKAPILRRYGVNYFVEDRLETCYLLKAASVVPIVFEQPWNKKSAASPAGRGVTSPPAFLMRQK